MQDSTSTTCRRCKGKIYFQRVIKIQLVCVIKCLWFNLHRQVQRELQATWASCLPALLHLCTHQAEAGVVVIEVEEEVAEAVEVSLVAMSDETESLLARLSRSQEDHTRVCIYVLKVKFQIFDLLTFK